MMSRLKASVIAWDMEHNALGRAYIIADMLRNAYDVELVGAHFVNHGNEIWTPLRDARITMRRFNGTAFPKHFMLMEHVAKQLDSDVLYVSKPRMPSYGLAVLAKERRNRPLILDADDREVSFFGLREGCTLADVADRRTDPDFVRPFGRIWTQYCESIVTCADRLTVSNAALAELYGGVIVPHARDEEVFDPAKYDRVATRARFGFRPDQRIVLFAGTPRSHKGLDAVAAALEELGDPRNQLCVFGTKEYRRLGPELQKYAPWIRELPSQPFAELPAVVTSADLVCAVQDPSDEISQFQIPAKITDAIAMGVPCLVRRTASVEPLVSEGTVAVVEAGESLAEAIGRILDEREEARERALGMRFAFLERYSYAAVRPVLVRLIDDALDHPDPLRPEHEALLAFQRGVFTAGALAERREGLDDDAVDDGRSEAFSEPLWRRVRAGRRDSDRKTARRLAESRLEEVQTIAAHAHGETQRLVDEIRREMSALDGVLARRSEIERIRGVVSTVLPDDAMILVVSSGDPDMVSQGTCVASHFPQGAGGGYAGHHPHNSEEAIRHLEERRAAGAEYLLFPSSAFWWRDQYSGFWDYLIETHTLLIPSESACAIFGLTPTSRKRWPDEHEP